jgi:hypothetical protein
VIVCAGLLAPLVTWQAARAHTLWADQVRATSSSEVLAARVASLAKRGPCAVVSAFAVAEVSVLSHCSGWSQLCPQDLASLRRLKVLIEGLAPAGTASDRGFATWDHVAQFDVLKARWALFVLRDSDRYVLPPNAFPCST